MAIVFKNPDEIASEYLTNLKALKPEVNTDQTDSDWWIRGKVLGGVVSGLYSDQRKIADDAFPQSARHEALSKHLFVQFARDFNPATQSSGTVLLAGTPGSTLAAGAEMVYAPNGNTYLTTESVTLAAATGSVPVQSVNSGQDQNLLSGAILTITSPPAGITSAATADTSGIANGSNEESDATAAELILAKIRAPISGGTETDYVQWARAASPSVTSAKFRRYPYGLGTVGLYIQAGTSDIDAAIDAGDPVVRVPTPALILEVKDYIDALNPTTDNLYVMAASEISQDVTVRVKYAAGYTGATILADQTLTLEELVKREVGRALYLTPIGGRLLGAAGYVLASEIEEVLDQKLSALPYAQGSIAEVLIDRQVDDLAVSGTNRLLAENEIVKPGTITVVTL